MAFFSDDGDLHLDDNLFEFWGALYDSSELDTDTAVPFDATDDLEFTGTASDSDIVSTSKLLPLLLLHFSALLLRHKYSGGPFGHTPPFKCFLNVFKVPPKVPTCIKCISP